MRKASLAVAVALVFAACGSGTLGDLGGILGSTSPSNASDIRGTVNYVDTQQQRIDMNVAYVNNLRDTQNSVSVYYGNNTRVVWQGNTYSVNDLERGDEVSIRGYNDNGRYVAETITVTRNVRQ